MPVPHTSDSTMATQPVLYLAFELGWTSWKLAFTVGAGQKPRLRSIPARDTDTLMLEIQNAKRRFGLPAGSVGPSGWVRRPAGHIRPPITWRSPESVPDPFDSRGTL